MGLNRVAHVVRMVAVLSTLTGRAVVMAGPHEHGEDVVVGRTESGQLAVEVPVPGPHELSPIDSFLRGWGGAEPGLMTLETDTPKEGLFVLGEGSVVNLEIVSLDPALEIWSPGFISVLSAPGQSFVIGGSVFDEHPTFHIDSDDDAFDPGTDLYSATFRLFDSGATGYLPSEPFMLSFAPVPEPAAVVLLAVGTIGMMLARRKTLSSGGGS